MKTYGDGVISELPEGTVRPITPAEDLNTERRVNRDATIEIDLADLCPRSPWINFRAPTPRSRNDHGDIQLTESEQRVQMVLRSRKGGRTPAPAT